MAWLPNNFFEKKYPKMHFNSKVDMWPYQLDNKFAKEIILFLWKSE